MGIKINSFFKISNSSLRFGQALIASFIGQVYRIVNTTISTISPPVSYTNINNTTSQTDDIYPKEKRYILALSGSVSDQTFLNSSAELASTSLILTSSVSIDTVFTEQLITTTGAGTWTKPAGVTQVIVECWGGGGAGGGVTGNPAGGAGGGGGQYSRKLITYPSASQTISYNVGAGGTGGTGNGPAGGDTTWNTTTVIAKGGTGGTANAITQGVPAVAGVGNAAGSVGDVIYFGGSGADGEIFSGIPQGGQGGYSAGSTGPGSSPFFGTPVKEYGGGGGGANSATSANGGTATNYGGGGGGAVTNTITDRTGGNGAQGLIRIIYREPIPSGQLFRAVSLDASSSITYTRYEATPQSVTIRLAPAQVTYFKALYGSIDTRVSSSIFETPTVPTAVITNLLIKDTTVETNPTFTEQIFTTTGAGTWTKPAGVTQVIVECWGGGGAGGGASIADSAGAGGGGGQFAKKFITYTSPSQAISYSIGAGATGGTGNGPAGGDTTWQTNVVVAKGGTGGGGNIDATALGGFYTIGSGDVPGSIGDVINYGADGGGISIGRGGLPEFSGPGGGAAGTAEDAPFQNLGGDELGGGGGGTAGGGISSNGVAGDAPGGGGSGAFRNDAVNRSGGSGGAGRIRIIYR